MSFSFDRPPPEPDRTLSTRTTIRPTPPQTVALASNGSDAIAKMLN
ncbi:MAG: hypothetical protein ACP5D7_05180 [Limnospira sp.]